MKAGSVPLARFIHEALSRNRQVCVRSSQAQRVALQAYLQCVEAQGASTA
jgi:hypothetical protein